MKIKTSNSLVKYYSTPSSCISCFERKPWIEKAISALSSFGNIFTYYMNKALMAINGAEKQMARYTKAPVTHPSSKKLVVCLHGLNNNPTQFKKIVDEMVEKDDSKSAIYIPKIRDKGNAKLDKMVAPILKNIVKWAKTKKAKELVLVGISNGGRIARAIEAKLINSGQVGRIKRLRFVSIVGACKGSSLVTWAKKLHASWLLSKNIAEEMPTDSKRVKRLETACKRAKRTTNLKRDYTFIASPHDWHVPNYSSSLMKVSGAKVKYALVPNHGHNSIVNAVADDVATLVMGR